jgi:SAM-dependent methyltransferase
VPVAYVWPDKNENLSYREKLVKYLPLQTGHGVEIGPLNIPICDKEGTNILYADHLDTDGLKKKYPHLKDEIVDVDIVIGEGGILKSLENYKPIDYIVASQALEHIPNLIGWMQEIADILSNDGLLSVSLPDRRDTFDLLRHETTVIPLLNQYFSKSTINDAGITYDHHVYTSAVNFFNTSIKSVTPPEIFAARGAIRPCKITRDHMALVKMTLAGEYLDIHAWVFTDWSFLMLMADLAGDGFIPFFLKRFYPRGGYDRGIVSFIAILQKTDSTDYTQLRKSFLTPLVTP